MRIALNHHISFLQDPQDLLGRKPFATPQFVKFLALSFLFPFSDQHTLSITCLFCHQPTVSLMCSIPFNNRIEIFCGKEKYLRIDNRNVLNQQQDFFFFVFASGSGISIFTPLLLPLLGVKFGKFPLLSAYRMSLTNALYISSTFLPVFALVRKC